MKKLTVEDFSEFGVREVLLSFEEFTREGKDMEINLNFCAEPARDNAWYQINIGECLEDEYKELEEHRFNSLKKAINWWNKYFEEEDNA